MDIIYYGELDPYGGVDQSASSVCDIVDELKLALLSADVVIVPPENLFEHRLALPVFEALAPFVRAGFLTTTTDRSVRRPADLVEERAALCTEDRLRALGSFGRHARSGTVGWTSQTQESDELDRERRNRLDQLKLRTNKALEPLGVSIVVEPGKGLWRIAHPAGAGHTHRLEGTLWALLDASTPPRAPAGVEGEHAALWHALAAAAPHYVVLPRLAEILGKACDTPGLKRTAEVLRELNQQLVAASVKVRVRRIGRGLYALIPAAGLAGET